MSAETAFKEHCGDGIKFVSTELFYCDRRREFREFVFEFVFLGGRTGALGIKVENMTPEDQGILGARTAKEWARLRGLQHRSQ